MIDTLRRPQRLFHPLHRELLATHWRRLALSVAFAALYTLYLLARLIIPGLRRSCLGGSMSTHC
ncbi:hypothetical protein NKG94_05885 [Micromonospora sp. M12]